MAGRVEDSQRAVAQLHGASGRDPLVDIESGRGNALVESHVLAVRELQTVVGRASTQVGKIDHRHVLEGDLVAYVVDVEMGRHEGQRGDR